MNAADMMAKYAVKDPTFEIALGDGDVLLVKSVSDVAAMTDIKKRTRKLVQAMAGKPPSAWKPFLSATGLDEETAQIVVEMSVLILEPKWTQLQAVQFCRESGPVAAYIHSQILMHMAGSVAKGEMEALAEAGEESGATSCGDIS